MLTLSWFFKYFLCSKTWKGDWTEESKPQEVERTSNVNAIFLLLEATMSGKAFLVQKSVFDLVKFLP